MLGCCVLIVYVTLLQMADKGSATHLGIEVGDLSLRQVWTDTAELLIKQVL